jgi:hypothetical protein
MDFETPAILDRSSSVSPRASLSRCSVAPTSGGEFVETGAFIGVPRSYSVDIYSIKTHGLLAKFNRFG